VCVVWGGNGRYGVVGGVGGGGGLFSAARTAGKSPWNEIRAGNKKKKKKKSCTSATNRNEPCRKKEGGGGIDISCTVRLGVKPKNQRHGWGL